MKKFINDYEISIRFVNTWEVFSYKGRRYTRGAFIPFLGEYEIHSIAGDICKTIEPCTKVKRIWNNHKQRFATIIDFEEQ